MSSTSNHVAYPAAAREPRPRRGGSVASRPESSPVALVYEACGRGNGPLSAALARLGWDVRVAHRDLGLFLTSAADLWAIDLGSPVSDPGPLLDALSALRAGVPLLLVAEEAHLETHHVEITALERGGPAPVGVLVRPYGHAELALRVSSLTAGRAPAGAEGEVYELGALFVDPGRQRVWFGDVPVPLRRSELLLLIALLRANGRVLTKEALLRVLHGPDEDYPESGIKTYINRLRAQLRVAGAAPAIIGTARGTGYYLDVAWL